MLQPNMAEGMPVPEAPEESVLQTQPDQNIFSPFTLYLSDFQGNLTNTLYKHETRIDSLQALACACVKDHSSNLFKDFKRSNKNYLENDVIIQDIDNAHSDDPEKWVYPEKIVDLFQLDDIEFCIVPSRNNWKIKHPGESTEQSERPRFHIYFVLRNTLSDSNTFNRICKSIQTLFVVDSTPILDPSLKDAGRQIFGTPDLKPNNDSLIHHPGKKTVLDYLKEHYEEIKNIQPDKQNPEIDLEENEKNGLLDMTPIEKGHRHTTLIQIAGTILTRYGDTPKSKILFRKQLSRCVPPFEDKSEPKQIWKDALTNFRENLKTDPFYVDPSEYEHNPNDKNVYLETVEKELQIMDVSIRNNVITGKTEISRSYLERKGNSKLDSMTVLITDLIDRFKYRGMKITKEHLIDCLRVIADKNRFNAFEEWVTSKPWDNKTRIESVIDVLNIDDNKKRQLILKWLYQVVFIALNDEYNPIGNEFVLVLKGEQGLGKTSFFRELFKRNDDDTCLFTENVKIDMDNKDTLLLATSCVCCELGELESTMKKEQADLKGFITNNKDEIRKPYARQEETYPKPRRTVFCATVNPDAWLRDEEGGRRWVTIEVDHINKILVGIDDEHDPNKERRLFTPDFDQQVWAEIYETVYLPSKKRKNQPFRLTESELKTTIEENLKYLPNLTGIDELTTYLDWERPIDEWTQKSASEIKEMLGLKASMLRPEHIGKALIRLSKVKGFESIKPKRTSSKKLFNVPPLNT